MRIIPRTRRAVIKEPVAPVEKIAALAPTVRVSEEPQPKTEVKSEVKVEEIKKEKEIIKVPKKRSLLEEVLEEQANLED